MLGRADKGPVSRSQRGSTLLELAIAFAILSILVGLARGAFLNQKLRAQRTEAVAGLESIYRAQSGHRAATNEYADSFAEIGFTLDGGRALDDHTIAGPIYTFTLHAVPLDGNPRGNFQAIATGDLDRSDPMLDILIVENGLRVAP